MPFLSQAQRRYMYLKHPEIAKRWEKETPVQSTLPQRVEASAGVPDEGIESVELGNKFKQTDEAEKKLEIETVSDDNSRMEAYLKQIADDLAKQ